MVHTSSGKLILQILEDHGKVILEVSFCFPQWKRNSGRGELINSCLDLSLLSGFLASHALSPILCSRGQWITHPAPVRFLLCLLYHYHSSKPGITKKNQLVVLAAKHLGAARSTFQIAHYQFQVRCAFVSLAISLSFTSLQKVAACKGDYETQQHFMERAKANVHLRLKRRRRPEKRRRSSSVIPPMQS